MSLKLEVWAEMNKVFTKEQVGVRPGHPIVNNCVVAQYTLLPEAKGQDGTSSTDSGLEFPLHLRAASLFLMVGLALCPPSDE